MSRIILGGHAQARLPSTARALAAALACLRPAPGQVDVAPHLRPLPKDTMMLLGKKGMDAQAPIFVRIFKEESELEVWKQRDDGRYYHFKTYPICNWSGELGPQGQAGRQAGARGLLHGHARADEPELQVPSGDEPGLSQRLRPRASAHRRVPDDPRQVQVGRLLRHDRRADRGDLRDGARVLHRRPATASRCTPSRSA